MPRPHSFAIFVALVIGLTLLRLVSAASTVPSYVAFDQDAVLTTDAFLVQSQKLPDHVAHPGLGVNLILTYTQSLAHSLGHLPIIDLKGLSECLNPLLPAIQVTDFNRAHSPVLVIASILLIWSALCLALRWPTWLSCLGLVALASQQGWIFQAMCMRSELYAVFFWSLGFVLIAGVQRIASLKRPWLISTAGFFFGLSFLTKIQVIFYLVSGALFLFYLLDSNERDKDAPPPKFPVAQALVALTLYGVTLLGAWLYIPLRGAGTFALTYGLNSPSIALGLLLLGLVGANLKIPEHPMVRATTQLILGFLCAPLIHFVVYKDPGLSLDYLFLDSKMVYLRSTFYNNETSPLLRLLHLASSTPGLLWVMASTTGIALWSLRANRLRAAILFGIALTALLTATIGSRPVDRDWMWVEVVATILALLASSILIETSSSKFRMLVVLNMTILIATNLWCSSDMAERFRRAQDEYGYRPWKVARGTFSANHRYYQEAFDSRFRHLKWTQFRSCMKQMQNYQTIATWAHDIARSDDPRQWGVAVVGFSGWVEDPNWLLSSVPLAQRDSLTLGLTSSSTQLRPKSDTAVWLCLEPGPYQSFSGAPPKADLEPLVYSKKEQRVLLYPIRIMKKTKLQPEQLGEHRLVLIKSVLASDGIPVSPDPSWTK